MLVTKRQAQILVFLLRNSSSTAGNPLSVSYRDISQHIIAQARTRSSIVTLSRVVRQLERKNLIAFDRPVPKFGKVRSVFLTPSKASPSAPTARTSSPKYGTP